MAVVLTDTICMGVINGPYKIQYCSGRGVSLMLTQSPFVSAILMMFMQACTTHYKSAAGSSGDDCYQLARISIAYCAQHYRASVGNDSLQQGWQA